MERVTKDDERVHCAPNAWEVLCPKCLEAGGNSFATATISPRRGRLGCLHVACLAIM